MGGTALATTVARGGCRRILPMGQRWCRYDVLPQVLAIDDGAAPSDTLTALLVVFGISVLVVRHPSACSSRPRNGP